jgi:hypothetical protein
MINKVNNMSYKRFLPIVLTLLLLASGQYLFSQKSTIFSYENKDFYKGLELFGKEKYGAAKNIFEEYIQDASFGKSELKAEAQYYTAMCAIELYNLDAEYLVFKFVNENPENPLQNSAYFSLADYMYKRKTTRKPLAIIIWWIGIFSMSSNFQSTTSRKDIAITKTTILRKPGCVFMRSRI